MMYRVAALGELSFSQDLLSPPPSRGREFRDFRMDTI